MGVTTKQKRMKKDERREQLVRKAASLFSDHGFDCTTTKCIADSAGISEAVIYQHFKTKDELYDAAIEFHIDQIDETLKASNALEQPNLREMLRPLAVGWLRFAEENVCFTRMMLYSGLQDHRFSCKFFNAISLPIMEAIKERIETGKREGWVRKEVLPMESTFTFMSSMVMLNLARNLMKVEPFINFDIEEFVDNAIDIFIRGISVEGTETR